MSELDKAKIDFITDPNELRFHAENPIEEDGRIHVTPELLFAVADKIDGLRAELAHPTAELAEDEFDRMPIEKINQYLREHGYDPEKVGLRGKILAEALTKNIIAREIIQRFLNNEGGCRFCEYDKYLPLDAPKNGHEENCLYLAARAYLDNDTSTVVKRDLSDAEIEELGAREAESRGDK